MFSKFQQPNDLLAVFMLETLKFSKTLKSSRDDFNVLENFNVSSIKTTINSLVKLGKYVHRETKIIFGIATFQKTTTTTTTKHIKLPSHKGKRVDRDTLEPPIMAASPKHLPRDKSPESSYPRKKVLNLESSEDAISDTLGPS